MLFEATEVSRIENELYDTWGQEWLDISQQDRWNVHDDITKNGITASELKNRVYAGNLQAYANCLSIEASKPLKNR